MPLGVPRFSLSVPRELACEASRQLGVLREGAHEGCAIEEATSGASSARDHREAGPYRTSAAELDEPMPSRQPRLAAFFAIGLAFGLGHVYAREYLAALILAAGQLACVLLAMRGIEGALWAFPLLMILDAYGAVQAARRENVGRRRDMTLQLATTLPAVALLLASAALSLPAPPSPERPTATWSTR